IQAREVTVRSLLAILAQELDLAVDTLTLSALAENVTHPAAHTLRQLAAILPDLVAQVERLNRGHAVLFGRTLEYFQTLGELLIRGLSAYQSSGALQPPRWTTSSVSHEA